MSKYLSCVQDCSPMLRLEQRSCSGSSTEMELGSLFDDCCSTIDTHFYVLVLTVELRNDGGTREDRFALDAS